MQPGQDVNLYVPLSELLVDRSGDSPGRLFDENRLVADKLWQEIRNLFRVRICIAHHSGSISRMRHRKRFSEYASEKEILDDTYYVMIGQYCNRLTVGSYGYTISNSINEGQDTSLQVDMENDSQQEEGI